MGTDEHDLREQLWRVATDRPSREAVVAKMRRRRSVLARRRGYVAAASVACAVALVLVGVTLVGADGQPGQDRQRPATGGGLSSTVATQTSTGRTWATSSPADVLSDSSPAGGPASATSAGLATTIGSTPTTATATTSTTTATTTPGVSARSAGSSSPSG